MKRMPKFGPRYGVKRFGEGGATDKKPAPKKPAPSPSDDLVPRGNLPSEPTIKPGAGFGDDIPRKKPVKKMAGGGMAKSSASKRADGCAVKGKTRGKFV